jgi:hypothetical protein
LVSSKENPRLGERGKKGEPTEGSVGYLAMRRLIVGVVKGNQVPLEEIFGWAPTDHHLVFAVNVSVLRTSQIFAPSLFPS